MRMREAFVVFVAALGAISMAPANTPAATVGADIPAASFSAQGCPAMSGCFHLQTKIAGDPVRAPFTGTATKLRIQGPSGSFGLVVLRKRPGGEFKHVRSTSLAPMSGASTEVVRRDVELRVRRRDYLAVAEPMGSTFATQNSAAGHCKLGFVPPPAPGSSSAPHSGYTACDRTLLYNVKVEP